MSKTTQRGAEEARNQLPALIDAAASGHATIITRRGKPVAALVPIEQLAGERSSLSLLPLAGSGAGLWGKSSTRTLRQLRDEWNR